MATNRLYVGAKNGPPLSYEVFRSPFEPTHDSHGDIYLYVIGPFQTRRGADYMAKYGRNNPHLQHVSDAEYFARRDAQKEMATHEA
jgi:hypothetical protein